MDDLRYRPLRELDHDLDRGLDGGTGPRPGKSTLSSRLTPPARVTLLRVSDPAVARALGEGIGSGRRDDNGVAEDAERVVERAAATSGAPLPARLQRQFEESLGADLSRVRVHTDAVSGDAAHAVGAKAYTVGQDIHFGAGKYQPDDPFGMHLLAHEVAHTVQQSGGPARRQHKLEVSTPHDAAEHEADCAADAMVRGEPATVGGSGGVQRQIAREADPAAAASPEASKGEAPKGDAAEGGKGMRPKLEGKSISLGVLPGYGGNLGFSWADGAAGALSVKGEKKKEWSKAYKQQVQFPGGAVGELSGEISADIKASATGALKTFMSKAPGPREGDSDMLTVSADGKGAVSAGVSGTVKLGFGAGVANVLSMTGGGYVGVSAEGEVGIKVGGDIENYEDNVNGAVTIGISGEVAIKASGGVYVDLSVPGDVYNIYKCELGSATIGSISINGGCSVTGEGGLVEQPITVTGECSFAPPSRVVETRSATPEERKKIQAQHPQEGATTGASGNRADHVPQDPQVEMSDEELWNAGTEKAWSIVNGQVGQVVPVADPHSGGSTVQAKVSGQMLLATVAIAESERRRLAEHGKAIDRVTRAQVARVRKTNVDRSRIMDGTVGTVDQVAARIIGMPGFEVDLVNPDFELKDAPMSSCKK